MERAIAAFVLAGALIGCGADVVQERACITEIEQASSHDEVVYDKRNFVGDDLVDVDDDPLFSSQPTVIEASPSFAVGQGESATQVRWEITLDYLLARVATPPEREPDEVVAVFRILAHAWDPCGHDTVPRQMIYTQQVDSIPSWWQARWFRVDWSENLHHDVYRLDAAAAPFPDAATYTPIPYRVDDPTHPHAPRIAPDEGFIELTFKQSVTWHDIVFLGAPLPGCAIDRADPKASCTDEELITLRHTFHALPSP